MNITRKVSKDLQTIGGLKEHLRHPLTLKWKGHSIDISRYNKKCLFQGLFFAAIPTSVGIAISRLSNYSKLHVISFTVISSSTFFATYMLSTLAKKINEMILLEKENFSKKSSDKAETIEETKPDVEEVITCLQEACMKGNAKKALEFIGKGPNRPDLHPAAHLSAYDPELFPVLEKILEHTPEALHQTDKFGFTPLHCAVLGPLAPLSVKKLLSLGAKVNCVSDKGLTPLDLLCANKWDGFSEAYTIDDFYKRTAEIVKMLLVSGATLSNFKDGPKDMNLVHLHINYFLDDEQLIALYKLGLSKPVADINGNMIIFHACASARPKLVKWLIEEAGMASYLFKSSPEFSCPALMVIEEREFRRKERLEIAIYLIEKDLVPPQWGVFAHIAADNGYDEVIEKMKNDMKYFIGITMLADGFKKDGSKHFESVAKTAKLVIPLDTSKLPEKIKDLAQQHGIL